MFLSVCVPGPLSFINVAHQYSMVIYDIIILYK